MKGGFVVTKANKRLKEDQPPVDTVYKEVTHSAGRKGEIVEVSMRHIL